jgi:acyl transferase domain-containing protein/NADP-dependent 3-hydroxy acid dehydrogenase YdfG
MLEHPPTIEPRTMETKLSLAAGSASGPMPEAETELGSIAIIGMAGCFPGAPDIAIFWQRLCASEEGLARFTAAELRATGIPPALAEDGQYIPVNGLLADIELFDSGFFGMSPREAAITDPQHRIFLELAWRALENSGYDPARFDGAIGVYAGCGASSYLLQNLLPNRAELADFGELRVRMATSQEYLATRTSFKLNLTGPSVSINTACSTSLVAVHLACDALRSFQCDMALGGGISIQLPQVKGYRYEPGGILSPDGHCRPFDAAAQGTVSGNGGAVVVLKRLADALADGDTIYAVIRGSAINNDGAEKAGYTAPSARGQAQVIIEAQDFAGVDPATIEYVETHGTGTPLGDPIEFAALTRAFRRTTQRRQFCAIGAVKSNVGHLDEAAGVTGLIKAVLALAHRRIPPSLHFRTPNPELDYDASPLFVNAALRDWPAPPGGTRRAGVSSFGIGGTNAHVVLEEAPPAPLHTPVRPVQFLPLSAPSAEALAQSRAALAACLGVAAAPALSDVAYTLQVGRRAFAWRAAVVAADGAEAIAALRELQPAGATVPHDPPPVVFMFGGQGSQYPGMAADLYTYEPVFRETLDRCADLLRPQMGLDLRDALYGGHRDAEAELQRTELAQPALFAVGYSLAQLWQYWGIRPAAAIGHSLGEYVAACVAGVFDLETALALVARRGQLMHAAPTGAMLAVSLGEAELRALMPAEVELTAVNAPDRCVIGGPASAVGRFAETLEAQGIEARLLHTSHAFHTAAMEPVLRAFAAELARIRFQPPEIPLISNVTGDWIWPQQATGPGYYLRQGRQAVRFADGLACVLRRHPDAVLLEVAPGQALTQAARRCGPSTTPCLASLPPPQGGGSPHRVMLASLGTLWAHGVTPDWTKFAEPGRRRVALPATPLQRQRHWIEAPPLAAAAPPPAAAPAEDAWCHHLVWRRSPPPPLATPQGHWMLLAQNGQDRLVAERLQAVGCPVTQVRPGVEVGWALPDERYEILWLASHGNCAGWRAEDWVHGLTAVFQAFDGRTPPSGITVVASGAAAVVPGEAAALDPEKGSLAGFLRAAAAEYPDVPIRLCDFPAGALEDGLAVNALVSRCCSLDASLFTAWRPGGWWRAGFERLPAPALTMPPLRVGATYLITGGLGGIGLTIAEYLAREWQGRLVLVGRTAVPPEAAWPEALTALATPSALRETLGRLQALRAAGAAVLVETADLSDEGQLAGAIARARARFGPLHGVVHAAGVPDGAVITRQRREAIDAVLAPKIAGTRRLVTLLKNEKLDFMILCSALSATTGAPGQAAYCAANGYLDNFALSGAAPWPIISIAWDEWREVGMAVRARQSGAHRYAFDHPLIDAFEARGDGSLVFHAPLSPARDWVLAEHRIGDEAILPGTAFLELAYSAACQALGRTAIALEEVLFLQPLRVQPDEEASLEIAIARGERCGFTISSRIGDGLLRVHAEGQIAAIDPSAEWFAPEIAAAQPAGEALRRSLARFGPRWQCLSRLRGSGRDHAELALPAAFAGADAGYRLHPALLDLATGFAVLDRQDRSDLLPSGYRRIAIYGRLPAMLSSHVTQYRSGPEGLHLDLMLTDTAGRTVASIQGYEFRRSAQLAANAENFRLALAIPSRLDSLGVEACARETPGAGEVEIEVFAAGLNFKEVLFAAGLLPEAEAAGLRFGLECAGRIVRAGPQSGPHRPGDAVIAYGPGCLQRFAIMPATQALPMPAKLSFAEGAGLPTAFVTAYYALVRQSRLQPGETVLIHAAAGGVGLAAVRIAQNLGATVLCTAGNPEKRAFLEQLGADGVFDSRNADFVEGVRRRTGGRGVDVVLNSLSGDLLRAGLSCLAPYGRFLELGVRDIHAREPLDLGYFAKAISFHAIGVGPDLPGFAELFREVIDKIVAGRLAPLPHKLFPIAAACDAFTYMARARHIGKVTVAVRPDAPARPEPHVEGGGLSCAEGLVVFRHALVSGQPHIIVSKRNPATLLARRPRSAAAPDTASVAEGAPRPLLPTPFVAPAGPAQTGLAAIWQRILGLAEIGANDDFFALGGDSLIGVQLIAQANRSLGCRLTLRQLFENPTIAGLASCLADPAPAVGIPPTPTQPDYPLSHAQRRLWILARNPTALVAYNMSYRLTLGGALDAGALRRAFGFVIARHESLRTAFIVVGGEPRAEIRPAADFELPMFDLWHGCDPEAAAAREIAAEAHEALALDDPPLLRARLLRLAVDRHILLLTVHHIVADGLSLNVLMRELHEAYAAYAAGRTPILPALPVQAKDIAVWEQSRLAEGALRGDREYWLEKLAGDLPVLDLPSDWPRPPEQQFGGSVVVMRLREGHAALHRHCREQGVSLFTMLVAAIKVLLHQLTGAEEILIGSPVAGRDPAELEGQIGHYLNTVVLRDTVRRSERFTVLLERVRATVAEALAHQSYPFDLLVEELAIRPPPGHQPLFDVQINLMPAQTPTMRLGDLEAAGFATDNGTTIFDLNFMFSNGPDALTLEIGYVTALFEASTVARWGESVLAVLAAIGEEPDRTVRSLCALIEGGDTAGETAGFLAAALQLDEEF